MFRPLLCGLALFLAAPLAAQQAPQQAGAPITPADMMRHIQVLASDDYQGRAPGTEGERLTINYIAEQFAARGLEPAGENGTWFQPVRLVERTPVSATVRWTANGADIPFDAANIHLTAGEASAAVADAPVVFVGYGVRAPDHGVDQLAGVDLRGAVALILADGPPVPGFPPLAERTRNVLEAGASAVIVILGATLDFPRIKARWSRPRTMLDSAPAVPLGGFMPAPALQTLAAAAGGEFARTLSEPPGPGFRAVALPLRVSLEATSRVQRFNSNNVVGRLRGSGSTGESVVFLGHWDHFGLCRPEGEADRICNGAVDNASGIAMMIEVAGRLAAGPRPARDILFLATTAEEDGLLGATYFAAHPTVPLASIAVAVNMDTVALHPAGSPVAVMGRGLPPLDAVIDASVAAMGRRLDPDNEAAELIERQDGWAFTQAGVPTIMIGGSFSDMGLVNAFFAGRYHKPSDQADGEMVLTGAAEDANLTVELARRLADPAQYQRPARSGE